MGGINSREHSSFERATICWDRLARVEAGPDDLIVVWTLVLLGGWSAEPPPIRARTLRRRPRGLWRSSPAEHPCQSPKPEGTSTLLGGLRSPPGAMPGNRATRVRAVVSFLRAPRAGKATTRSRPARTRKRSDGASRLSADAKIGQRPVACRHRRPWTGEDARIQLEVGDYYQDVGLLLAIRRAHRVGLVALSVGKGRRLGAGLRRCTPLGLPRQAGTWESSCWQYTAVAAVKAFVDPTHRDTDEGFVSRSHSSRAHPLPYRSLTSFRRTSRTSSRSQPVSRFRVAERRLGGDGPPRAGSAPS